MMERVESNHEMAASHRAHGHRHDDHEDATGLAAETIDAQQTPLDAVA
ncbi:MAG TPA: hypothetical protein VLB10_04900 [Gammaproteobacteria bacterium]|nr:hypothetical protein [Gammaproteobacteria bacterium]